MSDTIVPDLCEYIGFGADDAANVASLRTAITPHFPTVIEHFYETILRQPGPASVFTDPDQVRRLHEAFHDWLTGLFEGSYDKAYWLHRSQIGKTHVRVGLPQHYMFAAMEVVWAKLEKIIRTLPIHDAEPKLRSLHKLVTLETSMMLQSYKDRYSEQVRNIEREALHERLTRAEHLAQIGQLAATLAHEIKNPLAGISGAMEPDDVHRPILAEILRQIMRLDVTIKDLLIYARPNAPRFEKCELGKVIERALTVLEQEPHLQGIAVQARIAPTLPLVMADERQIEQVMLNLLLNAAHASTAGNRIEVLSRSNNNEVKLLVRDHGQGMTPDVAGRAFEPFFTNKAKGTGLGLPICKRIIEDHGGRITIDSSPGAGTTVTVMLPLRQEAELTRAEACP